MNKVLGIDLGTSNCCLAIFENERAQVLPDERGNRFTPSYLTILSNGKFLVGHLAKVQVISNPYQTAYAVKRLMGRRANDPQIESLKETVGYTIVPGTNDAASVKLGERVLSPIEISSVYMKAMKQIARFHLETDDIKDVVITVPAYFNDAQRTATKEAGEKAGFNVLRLINEPTAAALAYGFKKNLDKRIAIFDLGGGTFDISLLEISPSVFEVIGTHGNSYLGGYDFDNRIVKLVLDDFKSKHGLDLRGDKMALQRVKDACENAKCQLSESETATVNLPFIASGPDGSLNLDFQLDRNQFQEMTQDLIDQTVQICQKVLKDCNLQPNQIDDIILVGGQTRMPAVQKAVSDFFGKSPVKGVHPDEAVALGAAIQAGLLENRENKVLLLDVTPLTLGIKATRNMFAPMIAKNTKVPVSVSNIFTTTQDEQTRVKITVMQGESKKASENTLLGEFVLEGIRIAPRMEPQIKVTFRLDTDGILSVKAMDLDSQESQQITIRNYVGQPNQGKEPAAAEEVEMAGAASESLEVAIKE